MSDTKRNDSGVYRGWVLPSYATLRELAAAGKGGRVKFAQGVVTMLRLMMDSVLDLTRAGDEREAEAAALHHRVEILEARMADLLAALDDQDIGVEPQLAWVGRPPVSAWMAE